MRLGEHSPRFSDDPSSLRLASELSKDAATAIGCFANLVSHPAVCLVAGGGRTGHSAGSTRLTSVRRIAKGAPDRLPIDQQRRAIEKAEQ